MPTGYTDIIDSTEGDVSLKDFIWRCARAFGPFVMVRDEPLNAKVDLDELFKPSEIYSKMVKEKQAEVERIERMTLEEASEELEAQYRKDLEDRLQRHKETLKISEKYKRMERLVRSWEPPSGDHQNLKKFMLEQLDTGSPYVEKRAVPEKLDPGPWRQKQLKMALVDLEYYKEELAKEIARQNDRKRWVELLISSVGRP